MKFYKRVSEIRELAEAVVKHIPLSDIVEDLRTKKLTGPGLTETWYLMLHNKEDSFINTSNEGLEVLTDVKESTDLSWIYLKVTDDQLPENCKHLRHPLILPHITELADLIENTEEVTASGFHCVLKNSVLPVHDDYDKPKWCHILIALGEVQDVDLILSTKRIHLKNRDIVIFNPNEEHSIENNSDRDFICLVLQVEIIFYKELNESINT